jgi:predicted ATPase
MVQQLRLRNFRSFKDATIELRPLNILVGANASGKTNLVQAFRFLRDLARSGLENAVALQGGAEYLTNLQSREREVTIELAMAPKMLVRSEGADREGLQVETIRYELTIQTIRTKNSARIVRETFEVWHAASKSKATVLEMTREGRVVRVRPTDSPLLRVRFRKGERFELETGTSLFGIAPLMLGLPPFLFGENITIYDFSPKQAKQAIPVASAHMLSEDGSNLPLVVHQILRDPHQRERLLRLVQSVLPYIQHLHTTMVGGQHVQLQVQETYHGKRALPAILLSDGTVEVVALVIALFFSRLPDGLVILEEPDRNLHPGLMGALMELLRDAAETSQILVTTHNPELVRRADLEDLILIERNREGNSVIKRPANQEGVKIFLEENLQLDYLHTQQLLGV